MKNRFINNIEKKLLKKVINTSLQIGNVLPDYNRYTKYYSLGHRNKLFIFNLVHSFYFLKKSFLFLVELSYLKQKVLFLNLNKNISIKHTLFFHSKQDKFKTKKNKLKIFIFKYLFNKILYIDGNWIPGLLTNIKENIKNTKIINRSYKGLSSLRNYEYPSTNLFFRSHYYRERRSWEDYLEKKNKERFRLRFNMIEKLNWWYHFYKIYIAQELSPYEIEYKNKKKFMQGGFYYTNKKRKKRKLKVEPFNFKNKYLMEFIRKNLNFKKSTFFHIEPSLPSAVIVLNPSLSKHSFKETNNLKIPSIGILDSDQNPHSFNYPVLGNDKSITSISYLIRIWKKAIIRGSLKELTVLFSKEKKLLTSHIKKTKWLHIQKKYIRRRYKRLFKRKYLRYKIKKRIYKLKNWKLRKFEFYSKLLRLKKTILYKKQKESEKQLNFSSNKKKILNSISFRDWLIFSRQKKDKSVLNFYLPKFDLAKIMNEKDMNIRSIQPNLTISDFFYKDFLFFEKINAIQKNLKTYHLNFLNKNLNLKKRNYQYYELLNKRLLKISKLRYFYSIINNPTPLNIRKLKKLNIRLKKNEYADNIEFLFKTNHIINYKPKFKKIYKKIYLSFIKNYSKTNKRYILTKVLKKRINHFRHKYGRRLRYRRRRYNRLYFFNVKRYRRKRFLKKRKYPLHFIKRNKNRHYKYNNNYRYANNKHKKKNTRYNRRFNNRRRNQKFYGKNIMIKKV